jgi:PAS domain S-box-containing protein
MSENLYQAVFEQTSEGIILIDAASRRLLEVNRAFVELTGYPEEQIFSMSLGDFFDLPPVEIERIYSLLLNKKEHFSGEVKCRRSDNSLLDVELRGNLVHLEGKAVFCAGLHEVTLYRQAEKTLQEAATKFRRAIFSSPMPVMIHTEDGAVVMINNEWTNLTGYSFKDIPTTAAWVEKAFGAERTEMSEKFSSLATTEGPGTGEELSVATSSGEKLQWDFRSAPIGSLPEGERLIITMAMDVTERKRAEERLKASLKEKEVLLKEIHHRVKNNMQIISSLLNLQLRYIRNSETKELLRESQKRIKSMALIHEMLYRSQNLARIDFGKYTRTLSAEIMQSCGLDHNRLKVVTNINNIEFDIKTAIPCGLIIHELISNSLKHGFPNGRKGTIRIDLDRNSKRALTLVVGDDGIGFPKDLDFERTGSLGLSLVMVLTKQLRGSIERLETAGTAFRITFSDDPLSMQSEACNETKGSTVKSEIIVAADSKQTYATEWETQRTS